MGGKGSAGPTGRALQRLGKEYGLAYMQNTKAASQLAGAQVAEALQTGGVSARIPLIQQSIEASRQGASRALAGTRENLGMVGLENSPWGQAIMAQTRIQGEQATNLIGPQMAAEIAGLAPGLMTAGLAPMLGTAGQITTGQMQAKAAAAQGTAQGIGSGVG